LPTIALRSRSVQAGSSGDFIGVATHLPARSAKGSLTYDGATAELKFAAAFLDQKDERKPIVLLISEQKLAVENG
jgi:hypothetical protein